MTRIGGLSRTISIHFVRTAWHSVRRQCHLSAFDGSQPHVFIVTAVLGQQLPYRLVRRRFVLFRAGEGWQGFVFGFVSWTLRLALNLLLLLQGRVSAALLVIQHAVSTYFVRCFPMTSTRICQRRLQHTEKRTVLNTASGSCVVRRERIWLWQLQWAGRQTVCSIGQDTQNYKNT